MKKTGLEVALARINRLKTEFSSTCDRCFKENTATIMSMFNTDWLCFDCHEEEMKHPDYGKAREAELAAVKRGEYNFPGIGKPDDL